MEAAQAPIHLRCHGQVCPSGLIRLARSCHQLTILDKSEIAQILEEIGTLLELKGENPFKSRAYHNASRIIAGLGQDLETLVREQKLSTIKGIGEGLSEKITALVTKGRLPYYEELQKSLPAGL